MALTQDFLMRMLEKLAAAFFRILAGRESEDPEQAQIDIENLLAEALGTSRAFVLGLGPAAIDTVEPPLAAQLARLLCLHATLSERLNNPDRAARAWRMGFRGVERALTRPGTDFATIGAATLREHLAAFEPVILTEPLAEACVAAHEHAFKLRQWADAEDWIFFAMELAPQNSAFRATARQFYVALLDLTAEQLEAGNLTHAEVHAALDALEA